MSATAPIPGNVRRMIQDIKEIAGNHSDEEVYAVLKECSMDPNETTQRLLLQDTFHVVKRKRDKRKESNKEPTDSRWKPVVEGRRGRGGRANYTSRHVANDAGGGRSVNAIRENGAAKVNANTPSILVHNVETKSRIPTQSSAGALANGTSDVKSSFSSHGSSSQVTVVNCVVKAGEIFTTISNKAGADKDSKTSSLPAYNSEVFAPASDPMDPVLVPNLDACAPAVVGSSESEIDFQPAVDKTVNEVVSRDFADSELPSINSKGPSEIGNNYMHGKLPDKSPRYEAKQPVDIPQQTSSSSPSISSRPSSNYSNRSQQLSTPHKAGPNKEWKPKTSNVYTAHSSPMPVTSEIISATVEVIGHSVPASSSAVSGDDVPNLQKRLEELHFSDTRSVIIPNHLRVPESDRYLLTFGTFNAIFGRGASFVNGSNSDRCSTPLSELTQEIDENIEQPLPGQVASPSVEDAVYLDDFQSSTVTSENLASRETDVSSAGSTVQEYDQSKPEPIFVTEVPQHSIVQTAPTYQTLSLTPQMPGGQFANFEGTENHLCDASRLPSFVSGNSLVPSSSGPALVVSQAIGAMQSSIPVTQQPVPFFRQPAVHIAHYHPNYIPYNQYISPFFIQPATAIHPFLSGTAFPQQTPAGGMFAPPASAASANSVKHTVPQYKSGNNNAGNSTHVGMPTGYGTYNSTPAGYNPNPSVNSGHSNSNEDLTASQFKENNVYMTGQQSDGSAVWVAAPGHDISALQANSFYNLPPHQHLSFAPSQAGHGAFPGIYHLNQTVPPTAVHPLVPQSQPMPATIEMVCPPAGVYQQPQRAQINWANDY